mgnify:CR=1 FL=1|jgi:hypothetical protein
MAIEQPLYAPAKNLTWIIVSIVAIIVIYVLSQYLKVKKK